MTDILLVNDSPESPAAQARISRLMGAHMPTSGGLYKALASGKAIGCTAVQLFTASPRQWSSKPLTEADIVAFRKAREETGITCAVAHDSYLINLAAPSEEVLLRSQAAFRSELDRAELLGLDWVVTHMGAHLNQGEEAAEERLIASLKSILADTDALGYRVGIALETTAGQGSGLGWRFDQLGRVLKGAGNHPRLGVCLDTCHIFVAGYDLRSPEAYEATWAEFDREIGLDNLKVIHANDAKKGLGTRVDRHEHIGQGEIGTEAFARLMQDPRFEQIPIIVETPDSEEMHAVNLALLRSYWEGEAASVGVDPAGMESQMKITLHLFGHYSDFAQGEPIEMDLPSGSTLEELVLALEARDACFAQVGQHCRFAINEEYADLKTVLSEGCTVALLPPMSGG